MSNQRGAEKAAIAAQFAGSVDIEAQMRDKYTHTEG